MYSPIYNLALTENESEGTVSFPLSSYDLDLQTKIMCLFIFHFPELFHRKELSDFPWLKTVRSLLLAHNL